MAFVINHLAGRAKLRGLLSRRDSLQPVPPSSLHWGGESWCSWDGWLAGLFVCSTFGWSLGVLTVCLCHLWPADWIGVVGLWCHSVSNCWGWGRFHCDPRVPTVALDGYIKPVRFTDAFSQRAGDYTIPYSNLYLPLITGYLSLHNKTLILLGLLEPFCSGALLVSQ